MRGIRAKIQNLQEIHQQKSLKITETRHCCAHQGGLGAEIHMSKSKFHWLLPTFLECIEAYCVSGGEFPISAASVWLGLWSLQHSLNLEEICHPLQRSVL